MGTSSPDWPRRKQRRRERLERAIEFCRTIEALWRGKRLRWEQELFELERPAKKRVREDLAFAERLLR